MGILGLHDTSDFAANERPNNWRAMMTFLRINADMPLYALTSRMKKASTDDPVFYWWEKTEQSRRLKLSANISAAATSIAVASGALGFKEGDLFYFEQTAEVVRVTADPTGDTSLTVQRGAAGTTATLINATTSGQNPYIMGMGSAFEEGSLAPTGVNFRPSEKWNTTQIFRDTFEATNTARQTNLRTPNAIAEMRREAAETHSLGIERALWFGNRLETVENGKPLRYTNGVLAQIPTANQVTGATIGTDLETFEDYLRQAFKYGSSQKLGFCGNWGLMVVNQIVRKNSTYNIQHGVKEAGMNVSRLLSPFGELFLKTHPTFNHMSTGPTVTGGTTNFFGLDSDIVILDMDEIRYRYLRGRDTHFDANLQIPGQDGTKAGWITEAALEFGNPLTHFWIKKLRAANVDGATN